MEEILIKKEAGGKRKYRHASDQDNNRCESSEETNWGAHNIDERREDEKTERYKAEQGRRKEGKATR